LKRERATPEAPIVHKKEFNPFKGGGQKRGKEIHSELHQGVGERNQNERDHVIEFRCNTTPLTSPDEEGIFETGGGEKKKNRFCMTEERNRRAWKKRKKREKREEISPKNETGYLLGEKKKPVREEKFGRLKKSPSKKREKKGGTKMTFGYLGCAYSGAQGKGGTEKARAPGI